MGPAPTGVRPCPECGEPLGGRYAWEGRQLCWLCLPAGVRRQPRRKATPAEYLPRDPAYARLVDDIWTSLERRTEMPVFLLERGRIAAYCPACRDGTLLVHFIEGRDEPRLKISSSAGAGRCSLGCSAGQIREAIE